ncbi:MAG: type II toxin-antitoxin system HipA family toxin [Chlorobiales bacterium]|nr:type II toxin-antitoxin system HipA family toxin [Chlorobiales bacterium]
MYRPVDVIEVKVWNRTVGAVSLDLNLGFYVFEYDPQWQASGIELAPLCMPISQSIHVFPLLSEHTYKRLPAMLADAIPDDFGNALIDAYLRKEGVSKDSITSLDRLAYIGNRGMGALEFTPARGPCQLKPTTLDISKLVESSRLVLTGIIGGDRETEAAFMNLIQVGTSAGGARAKAVIAWNPQTKEILSGQPPATEGFEYWLLKIDGVRRNQAPGSHDYHGRVEYAYSLMTRASGITLSESRLFEENGRAHFMTRRFDRQNENKIHMQTLCALQHLDYKMLATYDYMHYFQTIKALQLPVSALEEAYRRMVFNVVASNCDDHTKNFSFLMDKSGKWSLAPAYDMTHACNPNGTRTYQHLMSVNGKFRKINIADFEAVGDRMLVPGYKGIIKHINQTVKNWEEFADAAGLPESEMWRIQTDFLLF